MTFLKRLFSGEPPQKASPPTHPAPAFGTTPWHPTHRHKKGGGYRLLGFGINEADRTAVAIYDDAEGTVWVRSKEEFEDGRFRPVSLVDPLHNGPDQT